MFKKCTVILGLMLVNVVYAQEDAALLAQEYSVKNIVRVKLWYDGIESKNAKAEAKAQELPEEIERALERIMY